MAKFDTKEQLLELIRAGLWDKTPNIDLFIDGVDWSELINLASQQTLLGIISDPIYNLEEAMRPPKSILMRMHSLLTRNRQTQTSQIKALGDLLSMLRECGVDRPVLLKGLGVSMNYIDPTARQCGDIDLYVGEKNYYITRDYLNSIGIKPKEESEIHLNFDFQGVPIEIHKYVTSPSNVVYNRKIFMEWCESSLEGENIRKVNIGEVEVFLPPYEFDVVYIFYHAWKHFIMGGIGLRQLCDWARYMDQFADKIDHKEIEKRVNLIGVKRPFEIFTDIAVKSLGLEPNRAINFKPSNNKNYLKVVDRIWLGGNFGFYRPEFRGQFSSILSRKIYSFRNMIRDMWFVLKIAPKYATIFFANLIFTHTIDNIIPSKRRG